MNERKELVRIKAFVNRQYFNENSIKLVLSIKQDNGSYEKVGATLWRTTSKGDYTAPYKKYLDLEDYKRLQWVDIDAEEAASYKDIKQYVVREILGTYLCTPEKYEAKIQARIDYLAAQGYSYKDNTTDTFRDVINQPVETTPTPVEVKQPQPETSAKIVKVDNGTNIDVPVEDVPWELDL